MAKVKAGAKKQTVEGLIIGKKNIYFFLMALVSILIAYILMAQPPVNGFLSRTLAPIILFIAYIILIPIAIFIRDEKSNTTGG